MTVILVLGGTGMLGAPTVRQLVADGFDVRVLSRHPELARQMFTPSVDVVEGDATDPTDVENALSGCGGVHISVSGPAEPVAVELVAAAAPRHGADRITYLSGATVHQSNAWFPMVAQKLRAETALRSGATSWTVLCPTWPMEQLPRFVIDGHATVIGDQPTPLHWYAAADLARMVSRAFQVDDAANRRLFVHGPQGLPMRAAVERFCRAVHPDIDQVAVMPLGQAHAAAEATGNDVLRFMTDLMGYFDRAGERGDPTDANRLLGAPTTTLDEWLAGYSDDAVHADPGGRTPA
jgi:uncharacterized protein YbjT (DUF2867 family)